MVLLFELIIGLIVLSFLFTQIALPTYHKSELFPFFKHQRKLERSLTETNQDLVENELKQDLQKLKKKLKPKD